jgi:hypothetical protein
MLYCLSSIASALLRLHVLKAVIDIVTLQSRRLDHSYVRPWTLHRCGSGRWRQLEGWIAKANCPIYEINKSLDFLAQGH